MKEKEIYFSKLNPEKVSFSFTWDDNFYRHIQFIAPAFEQYNLKCTFYVNPGEPNFVARLAPLYARLSLKKFEIGSHGYTHHHFSKLTEEIYMDQLIESRKAIELLIKKPPVTFAFPHHDYTNNMLHTAYDVYFETRNTLKNGQRFSLKRNTSLIDVTNMLENTVSAKKDLVFSGHSVSLTNDKDYSDGYEPLPLECLHSILKQILLYVEYADICTFEQAALKEYIKNNCSYTSEKFILTYEQCLHLEKRGLALERIKEIV